ncbi:MAG: flagellar hook-associated protein FlgK [Gammaproteobacteria bacterium]|nr:flagellar hook-associated protein FlgK [Gammaproteobacteria bacterium]
MSDFVNNAVTGLLSYQRTLGTISHNIANATTPGFSRQQTLLSAQPAVVRGREGNGVQVLDVRRHYDQFLTLQLRDTQALQSQLEAFHSQAALLDDVLADPQGGVTPALQAFFSAVQELADDPASTTARIALLNEGDALAARFHYLDDRMADQATSANQRIEGMVNEINALARSLGEINQDILGVGGSRAQSNPDLLDRRDQTLLELSKLVTVSAVEQADGRINVFIGSGQTLVTNDSVFTLSTFADAADASRLRIGYNGVAGSGDITDALNGGELGGVLQYSQSLLPEARNMLGRVAIALAQSFNAQHRDGMDLNGNLGGDFFSVAAPPVLGNANNIGAATVTAAVTDITQLTVQDYTLGFDGALFTLSAADGSSSVAAAGPTLTLDGITVNVAGAAAAGDSFIIRPTRIGGQTLAVAIADSDAIAAAVPITTSTALGNAGSASISTGEVLDVNDPNLLDTITLRFNSATDYDVLDPNGMVLAAAQPYTSGANIDINGWRVQISGVPQAGDSFTVQSNVGGISDNRNALLLGGLPTTGIIDGGTATYQEAYSSLVGSVGAQTREARVNADAQQTLFDSVQGRRESVSGVNLDEEAANLIRFQQAYQASARVIATADELFQSLLNAV